MVERFQFPTECVLAVRAEKAACAASGAESDERKRVKEKGRDADEAKREERRRFCVNEWTRRGAAKGLMVGSSDSGNQPAKRVQPTSALALVGSVRRACGGAAERDLSRLLSGRGPSRQARRTATSSGERTLKTRTPNQTPEPTRLLVTIPADAGLAPSSRVAHL